MSHRVSPSKLHCSPKALSYNLWLLPKYTQELSHVNLQFPLWSTLLWVMSGWFASNLCGKDILKFWKRYMQDICFLQWTWNEREFLGRSWVFRAWWFVWNNSQHIEFFEGSLFLFFCHAIEFSFQLFTLHCLFFHLCSYLKNMHSQNALKKIPCWLIKQKWLIVIL